MERLYNALVFARDTGILLALLTIGVGVLALVTKEEFARNMFCICVGCTISNYARS